MQPNLDWPTFEDHPDFKPAVTPKLMLELGVFGGCYFGPVDSPEFIKNTAEFPAEWFVDVDLTNEYQKNANCFQVKSGKDYQWWVDTGLMHPDDPLGWFHWYCRFYMGRRHEDDARQIQRWKNFRRWETNILNSVPGQIHKRPVVRQSLLHWAYNPFI